MDYYPAPHPVYEPAQVHESPIPYAEYQAMYAMPPPQLHFPYPCLSDCSYLSEEQAMPYHPQQLACAEFPLYAPVPTSVPTLLVDPNTDQSITAPISPPSELNTQHLEEKPVPPNNPLDVYLDAPQEFFPTPSELLADMNARDQAARSDTEPSDTSSAKSATPSAKRKREPSPKPENLNQRKAYFRAVSDNVGFTITDPDRITSHDKKRSYLECLEEYVQWLHEEVRRAGEAPVPLERISKYDGLSNRSLRTMLVHKQAETREANSRKVHAEARFRELQSAVLLRQAIEENQQFRRHSIAMGSLSRGPSHDIVGQM